jgi:hypothetical protein
MTSEKVRRPLIWGVRVIGLANPQVIQVIDSNSESESDSLPASHHDNPALQRRSQLTRHCLCFPQHFPEKGFCDGQVHAVEVYQDRAADKTARRAFSRRTLSFFPEQHQEAKVVNTQGIGWSGEHGLRIGHYRLSR